MSLSEFDPWLLAFAVSALGLLAVRSYRHRKVRQGLKQKITETEPRAESAPVSGGDRDELVHMMNCLIDSISDTTKILMPIKSVIEGIQRHNRESPEGRMFFSSLDMEWTEADKHFDLLMKFARRFVRSPNDYFVIFNHVHARLLVRRITSLVTRIEVYMALKPDDILSEERRKVADVAPMANKMSGSSREIQIEFDHWLSERGIAIPADSSGGY